jgi:hypothetical protein
VLGVFGGVVSQATARGSECILCRIKITMKLVFCDPFLLTRVVWLSGRVECFGARKFWTSVEQSLLHIRL